MHRFVQSAQFVVLTVILLFALSGCSSWTKERCMNTNWEALGYADGSKGQGNASGTYVARCEKKQVHIDPEIYSKGYRRGLEVFCSSDSGYSHAFSAKEMLPICTSNSNYQSGYQKGLKAFCTYENGLKRGEQGMNLGRVCRGPSATQYEAGYKKGRPLFVTKRIKDLKDDLLRARRDLDEVRDEISDKQYQLNRLPMNTHESSVISLRDDLDREIQSLLSERDSIRSKINSMEDDLVRYERELNSY